MHAHQIKTPHDYAIARGWDPSHIEATARLGIAAEDLRDCEAAGIDPEALLTWCVQDAMEAWVVEQFDSEAIDASKYSVPEAAALDGVAYKLIGHLAVQDQARGLTRASLDGWYDAAGAAGDLMTCRAIDWARARGLDPQRIYDAAQAAKGHA